MFFTLQLSVVFIELLDDSFILIFYSCELGSMLGLFGLIEADLLIEVGNLTL